MYKICAIEVCRAWNEKTKELDIWEEVASEMDFNDERDYNKMLKRAKEWRRVKNITKLILTEPEKEYTLEYKQINTNSRKHGWVE